MADSAKDVAERLAGPHDGSCFSGNVRVQSICTCSRRNRVAAIEAAIREARRQGREEMMEWAAKAAEGYDAKLTTAVRIAAAIRALPLEGPGKEGR